VTVDDWLRVVDRLGAMLLVLVFAGMFAWKLWKEDS